jgi:GH15 family glucan-1,4-alpha-glucosidase
MTRPGMQPLIAASVAGIMASQSPYGSFVASPDFGQYQFCWLRDGSFIAHALDGAGEHAAAARFHRWTGRALHAQRPAMEAAVVRGADSDLPFPPARFTLDGAAVDDGWPNFQIDGYGVWLWSLREHVRRGGDPALITELAEELQLTWRYIGATALDPCFDVWEEYGGDVHTSTLGCVQAGLLAAADLLGEPRATQRAAEVGMTLAESAARLGRYPKSSGSAAVDASTLWLCSPLGLVAATDPVMTATIAAVEDELVLDGGIRRYPADSYYGGGAWPVLTASLGLCQLARGDTAAAGRSLAWIEAHVDAAGRLAEQFGGEHRDPQMYQEWVDRWGHPARDLLWSHAQYVVLGLAVSAAALARSGRTAESPAALA